MATVSLAHPGAYQHDLTGQNSRKIHCIAMMEQENEMKGEELGPSIGEDQNIADLSAGPYRTVEVEDLGSSLPSAQESTRVPKIFYLQPNKAGLERKKTITCS